MIPAGSTMTQQSRRQQNKLAAIGMRTQDASGLLAPACHSPGGSHASVLITDPERRACGREVGESPRHFERPLLCESPRRAHPRAASREPRPERRPRRRSDREPASTGFLSVVNDAGSPLNNHRSGDQQHKKDRHQYRRYQPLTKIECGEFWHVTALLVEAGAQRSQSPITARGARRCLRYSDYLPNSEENRNLISGPRRLVMLH